MQNVCKTFSRRKKVVNAMMLWKELRRCGTKPLKELGKVDNPTETDETEDEKNELVILDDADNWFPVSFVILLILSQFVKIKTWELGPISN